MARRTETRRFPLEFRAGDGGSPGTLSGWLVKWGDVADIGGFRERFAQGALRFADRVVANVGHDRGRPVASTGGGGLELRTAPEGVKVEVVLPDTADGRDVATLARRGVLSGFSVEMGVRKDSWVGGLRTIRDAVAGGIGIVDTPAYPASEVAEIRAAAKAPAKRRIAV